MIQKVASSFIQLQANEEGIRKAMKSMSRICGPYWLYSSGIQTKIVKYASHHGVTAASHFFLIMYMIFSNKIIYTVLFHTAKCIAHCKFKG